MFEVMLVEFSTFVQSQMHDLNFVAVHFHLLDYTNRIMNLKEL